MFRLFKTASRFNSTLITMPLLHLEKLVSEQGAQYIKHLDKKNELYATFKNESLTAKKRCEVYPELKSAIDTFQTVEKKYTESLKILESRLAETLSEEQKASYESSKFK